MLGFNDLRNHLLKEDDFTFNMRAIISSIRKNCNAKIVLGDIPHMVSYEAYGPIWNHGSREKSDLFCRIVEQLGKEFGLPVAKVHASMDHEDSLVCEDGVHPNKRGHEKMADAFWDVIRVIPEDDGWIGYIRGADFKTLNAGR